MTSEIKILKENNHILTTKLQNEADKSKFFRNCLRTQIHFLVENKIDFKSVEQLLVNILDYVSKLIDSTKNQLQIYMKMIVDEIKKEEFELIIDSFNKTFGKLETILKNFEQTGLKMIQGVETENLSEIKITSSIIGDFFEQILVVMINLCVLVVTQTELIL